LTRTSDFKFEKANLKMKTRKIMDAKLALSLGKSSKDKE